MGRMECVRRRAGPAAAGGIALLWLSLCGLGAAQGANPGYVRGTEAIEKTLGEAEQAVAGAKRGSPADPDGQYHLESAERSLALVRREFERTDWGAAQALAQRALEHA